MIISSYRTRLKSFFFLICISPLLGLVEMFKIKNRKLQLVASALLMMLFGALFTYPSYSDGGEHLRRSIEYYTYMGFGEFIKEFYFIIIQQPNTTSEDLYIHILCFVTNSLFGLPEAMHAIAGLVLGIVIFKSIWITLGDNLYRLTWGSGLLYFVVLLFVFTVHSLNAIRISTAMWVAYYGILAFYKHRKLKYVLIVLLASQIHFAYYFIGFIGLAAVFTMKFRWVLILGWLLSFSFSSLSGDLLKGYLPQTEVMEEKSRGYILDEDRLSERGHDTVNMNWYKSIGSLWFKSYAVPLLAVLLLPFYIKDKNSSTGYLLMSVFLTLSIVSSFFSFLPSLQGRMMNLGNLTLVFGAILIIQRALYVIGQNVIYVKIIKGYSWLFLILSTPYILENISHIINTTEVFFIIAPVLALFLNEPLSIKEFILAFL